MIFAYDNRVDLATTVFDDVFALGHDPTLLDNLKVRQLTNVYHRSGVGTNKIEVDFVTDQSVQVVGYLNHNITRSTPMNIELIDSASATIASSGVILLDEFPVGDIYTRSIYHNFGQLYTNVRTIEFTWVDTTPPTRAYVGRIWAGPVFVPTEPGGKKYNFGVSDPSKVTPSRGGQAYADEYNRLRQMKIKLPALTEAEAFGDISDLTVLNVQDMLMDRGKHKELLILPYLTNDTLAAKWSFYGHFGAFSDIFPVVFGPDETRRRYTVTMDAIEER